jgi:threonylcarbamoyladenosine tRNA methylthiotransferase MtaB
MPPETLTFGCRLNALETEAMRGLAHAAGLDSVLIVNTCAVTAEAEAQARQAIRRAAREAPGRPIIVTGCAAEIAPAAWLSLPGVVRRIGNADKLRPAAWTGTAEETPVMQARDLPLPPALPMPGRSRAFLQVQQGCDHRCTFCVIPYGRGPSRSLPAGEVVARAQALVAHGAREVVLTGVDIASWGRDLPGEPRLGGLVRRLLTLVPDLPRLRLSSVDPAAIDDQLWLAIAEEPRLMPHLHLSAQHGADLILKRMKRRHGRAALLALAARARALRPDMALGADLIAGFPTEDEPAFAELLSLVDEAGLSFLHVFPYSLRTGTPAARMPQLPRALVRERAARLRAAGDAARARLLGGRVGQIDTVLTERGGRGHTAQFAPVVFRGAVPAAGLVLDARVTGCDRDALFVETV